MGKVRILAYPMLVWQDAPMTPVEAMNDQFKYDVVPLVTTPVTSSTKLLAFIVPQVRIVSLLIVEISSQVRTFGFNRCALSTQGKLSGSISPKLCPTSLNVDYYCPLSNILMIHTLF